jgi:hypothetical protein
MFRVTFRQNKLKITLLFCLFVLADALSKGDKVYFFNIRLEESTLVADFQCDRIMDPETLKGLQKGLTATVEYQVQLWRDDPRILKHLVTEKRLRLKIDYDNWERKYRMVSKSDNPIFLSGEALKKRCDEQLDLTICPTDKLENESKYHLTMHIIVQPMTVENVEEVRKWLAGEVDDFSADSIEKTKSPFKKLGGWVLGLVVNLTGFGERVYDLNGPVFALQNSRIELFENPD